MNQIEAVTTWIDAAQQKPSVRNVANYMAYTLSECSEMLIAVCSDKDELEVLANLMERISVKIRAGHFDPNFDFGKLDLLDAAIHTAWCAIGLAHMLGDAQGAFAEVANSNHSKFENGVCELDATGKVVKGPSYFKPELTKFLRGA